MTENTQVQQQMLDAALSKEGRLVTRTEWLDSRIHAPRSVQDITVVILLFPSKNVESEYTMNDGEFSFGMTVNKEPIFLINGSPVKTVRDGFLYTLTDYGCPYPTDQELASYIKQYDLKKAVWLDEHKHCADVVEEAIVVPCKWYDSRVAMQILDNRELDAEGDGDISCLLLYPHGDDNNQYTSDTQTIHVYRNKEGVYAIKEDKHHIKNSELGFLFTLEEFIIYPDDEVVFAYANSTKKGGQSA